MKKIKSIKLDLSNNVLRSTLYDEDTKISSCEILKNKSQILGKKQSKDAEGKILFDIVTKKIKGKVEVISKTPIEEEYEIQKEDLKLSEFLGENKQEFFDAVETLKSILEKIYNTENSIEETEEFETNEISQNEKSEDVVHVFHVTEENEIPNEDISKENEKSVSDTKEDSETIKEIDELKEDSES